MGKTWGHRALIIAVLCMPKAALADVSSTGSSDPTTKLDTDALGDCISAHREARAARERQTLIQARAELRSCASLGCPIAIRAECNEWLNEAERQVPTLVFSAHSEQGDVVDAKVRIDGQLVADSLDGRPLEAPPGPHVVTFELPDGRRQEVQVVVGIGEKDRSIRAEFVPLMPAQALPPKPFAPTSLAPALVLRTANLEITPRRRLGIMLGLAALGGAAIAGSFMYVGLHQRGETRDRCAPLCSDSEVAQVRRWFIIADVVGLAAAVTGGTGLYLYLSGSDTKKQPGAVFGWRGEF